MKYKVTLNNRTYEVEVEAGQAMLLDEYDAGSCRCTRSRRCRPRGSCCRPRRRARCPRGHRRR